MAQQTGGEIAYQRLRDALMSGRYAPGQRLIEPDVVADLDVPRLALREAFARLEHEGLVQRQTNRGAAVRLLSLDEALEVLEIRGVVEGLAARHAASNATEDDIAELRAAIVEFDAALAESDLSACTAAQARLHGLINAIARRPTAARLAEMLSAQSAQTRLRTSLTGGRLRRSREEHQRIVDAIAAHDPDAAEAAMRSHLATVAEAAAACM